jgi:hypothetical protein
LEFRDNRFLAELAHPAPQVTDITDCPGRLKADAKFKRLVAYGAGFVEISLLQVGIGEQDNIEGSPPDITVDHIEGPAGKLLSLVSLAQFFEAVR